MMQYCECGCGKEIIQKYSWYAPRYIMGHGWVGKKHSERTKELMSKSRKGIKYNLTEEQRKRFREMNRGRKQSPETIRKRTLKMIGKGKIQMQHKEQEIINYFIVDKLSMAEIAIKMGCSTTPIREMLMKYGLNTSLKGRPLQLKNRIKLSQNAKINPNYGMKGKHHSEETRDRIRKLALGRPRPDMIGKRNPMYGVDRPKEWREHQKVVRMNQIFPKVDTKIEVKIQSFLKELGVEFFTHQYMKEIEHGYQCDILIPSMNMVIECDGVYWHKYPVGKEIDHIRTKELIEKGFKVLRLWESEIKTMNNPKELKLRIKELIRGIKNDP